MPAYKHYCYSALNYIASSCCIRYRYRSTFCIARYRFLAHRKAYRFIFYLTLIALCKPYQGLGGSAQRGNTVGHNR